MENKTLIGEIKNLMVKFGFLKAEEEVVELQFIEAKLVDGTIIRVEGETIAIGGKVTIISEDGEVPAPDGEYTLEDESILIVKDGAVEEIKEPEPVVEVDVPEEVPAEMPMEVSPEIMELVDLLKDFIGKCGDKIKQMETQMEEMQNQFNQFSKLPAGKPIPDGKTIEEKESNLVDVRLDAITKFRNKK